MISWDKSKVSSLDKLIQKLNIVEIKGYELTEEQVEFAKKYSIPSRRTYYSLNEINQFISLSEEYQELIEVAEILSLDWDYSKFNYEGLKKLVNERLPEKKQ
jgi:CO dehydrogenase/acetyl-CoA synthase delta subunit